MGNTAACQGTDRKDTEWSIASDDSEIETKWGWRLKGFSFSGAPSLMRNSRLASDGLQVYDLQFGSKKIDPTISSVRSQLLKKLGLSSTAKVERFGTDKDGNVVANGFNNGGLWSITDPSDPAVDLIVKRVPAELEEGKKFQELIAEFPGIASDPLLAFPSHIFRCVVSNGKQPDELIVMPKAKGVILHDLVVKRMREDPRGAHNALSSVFEQIGSSLAEFHARYKNKQHADFQVANIVYNEASQRITFIDVANMGCHLNPPGSDVTQFKATIQAIYNHRDRSLAAALEKHFVRGYSRRP